MLFAAGNFAIGIGASRTSYLPGGDWSVIGSSNHVPSDTNQFCFLEVVADFTAIDGPGTTKTVYVPCYFRQ